MSNARLDLREGTLDFTIKNAVVQQRVRESLADLEGLDDDDGFLIKHLMVNLFHFVQYERLQRRRYEVVQNVSPTARITPLASSNTFKRGVSFIELSVELKGDGLGTTLTALKLMNCIARIRETTFRRRLSEKLQDIVLVKSEGHVPAVKAKAVELNSFVTLRQGFWQCFRAPTQKWEGPRASTHSMGPSKYDSPGTRRQQMDAVAAAADHYLNAKLESRKPASDTDAVHNRHKNLRQFCERSQGLMDASSAVPVPQALAHCHSTEENTEKRLNDVINVSPTKPIFMSDLPGWKDFGVSRRLHHRLIDAGADKSGGCSMPTCACCRVRSHKLLQQAVDFRGVPHGKPITSIVASSDLPSLIEKSRVRTVPMCGSLPVKIPKESRQLSLPSLHVGPHPDSRPDQFPISPPVFQNVFADSSTFPVVRTAMWRYFEECKHAGVLPKVPRVLLAEAGGRPPIYDQRGTRETLGKKNHTSDISGEDESGLPFNLANAGITDADLAVLGEVAYKLGEPIASLDLSENLISDSAIVAFLEAFPGRHLRVVDLSNTGIGPLGASACLRLVERSWPRLKRLLLRGCVIGSEEIWRTLGVVITEHVSLSELCIADTRLGVSSQRAVEIIAGILKDSQSLEELDISGNFLQYEGCDALALALQQGPLNTDKNSARSLRCLDVSHNAWTHARLPRRLRVLGESTPHGDDLIEKPDGRCYEDLPTHNPLAVVCEALAYNRTLEVLRMVESGVDLTTDLALLAALAHNTSLRELDVSGNPHGVKGIQSLIQLMITNKILTRLDFSGFSDASDGPGVIEYNLGAPADHCTLDLTHPQHRALLLWILFRAEQNGISPPQKAITVTKWSGSSTDWSYKKDAGSRAWAVPRAGRLEFAYEISLQLEKEESACAAVNKWLNTQLARVSLTCFSRLFFLYESLPIDSQKLVFIKALGESTRLKTCQLMRLLRSSPKLAADIARHLYGHIDNDDPMLFFELVTYKDMAKRFRVEAHRRFNFSAHNPTNSYSLELQSPLDRAVAVQLHIVNLYEQSLSEKRGGPDLSQYCNREGSRNVMWQSESVESFMKLNVTTRFSGNLSLDYSSPPCAAPRRKQRHSTDIFISDLINIVQTSTCALSDKVRALRCVSHHLLLTAAQVQRICTAFLNLNLEPRRSKALWAIARTVMRKPRLAQVALGIKSLHGSVFARTDFENARSEVFVLLFNRCIEQNVLCTRACLYNGDLFSQSCTNAICKRLGYARTFDALHCCEPWRLCFAPRGFGAVLHHNIAACPREAPMEGVASTGKGKVQMGVEGPELSLEQSRPRTQEQKADKGLGFANMQRLLTSIRAALDAGEDPEVVSFSMDPGRRYRLHLDVNDERLCAFFLCTLNGKEGGDKFVRCTWSERARMSQSGYDFIPPKEWGDKGPVPLGIFTFTYASASQESINLVVRRNLAERFFAWQEELDAKQPHGR